MSASKKKYEVLRGINYPPEKRAEIGAVVDDIPATSIPWLIEQGIIREVVEQRAPWPTPAIEASEDERATGSLTEG